MKMSRWPGDDGKKPEAYITDNNEYTEQSLNLKEHGMKIFVKKRKILKIRKGKETAVKIHTGWKEIYSNMDKFCCIGNMITTDAKSNREIKRRIAIEK